MKFLVRFLVMSFAAFVITSSQCGHKYNVNYEIEIPEISPESIFIVGNAKDEVMQILLDTEPFDYQSFFQKHITKFKDVPYGSGAVGAGIHQTLVCTSKLNCVTFIEMFWALCYTKFQIGMVAQSLTKKQVFHLFIQNLNHIKYYYGHNCELHDRIHYFTDALRHLEKYGIMEDIAVRNGIPVNKKIQFISGNKKDWAAIRNWTKIKVIEDDMNSAKRFFYPIEDIENYEEHAVTGDIVALATDIIGLDVSHCGYITYRNDSLLFTHASSVKKKVVIEEDLCEYLAHRTSITGIYVYRPLFRKDKLNYSLLFKNPNANSRYK